MKILEALFARCVAQVISTKLVAVTNDYEMFIGVAAHNRHLFPQIASPVHRLPYW
ncbi:hypothetical protein ACLOJK_011636 [Asimina triloba]